MSKDFDAWAAEVERPKAADAKAGAFDKWASGIEEAPPPEPPKPSAMQRVGAGLADAPQAIARKAAVGAAYLMPRGLGDLVSPSRTPKDTRPLLDQPATDVETLDRIAQQDGSIAPQRMAQMREDFAAQRPTQSATQGRRQPAADQVGQFVQQATANPRLAAAARGAVDAGLLIPEAGFTTGKLAADIVNLGTLGVAQPVSDWLASTIDAVQSDKSQRYQGVRSEFAKILNDPEASVLDIAGFMASNPVYTVEMGIPSVPSMLVGLSGARLGAALMAKHGASAGGAAAGATGANVAMNAGATFSDTQGSVGQKLTAAGAAAAGTALAGRLGGAEMAMARGVTGGAVRGALTTGSREAAQESAESFSQSLGQGTAEGNFDLSQAAKQAASEGIIGGLIGGGAGAVAEQQRGPTPEQQIADAINRNAAAFEGYFAPKASKPLPPTKARVESLSRFDELSAAFGLNPKAAAKVREQAGAMPAGDVPGFLARATEALNKRNLFRKPVEPDAVSQLGQVLGDPAPEPAQPATAPAAPAAEDFTGLDAAELAPPTEAEAGPLVEDVAPAEALPSVAEDAVVDQSAILPLDPEGEAASQPRIIGKIGRTPNAAEAVELRTNEDGTLTPYQGKYPMLGFDSGEPIVIAPEATDAQAMDAIKAAGALSTQDRIYGVKPDEPADILKAPDDPNAARTAGPRAADGGRGAGSRGLRDEPAGDVAESAAAPSGEGVDGGGAAGPGAGGSDAALTAAERAEITALRKKWPGLAGRTDADLLTQERWDKAQRRVREATDYRGDMVGDIQQQVLDEFGGEQALMRDKTGATTRRFNAEWTRRLEAEAERMESEADTPGTLPNARRKREENQRREDLAQAMQKATAQDIEGNLSRVREMVRQGRISPADAERLKGLAESSTDAFDAAMKLEGFVAEKQVPAATMPVGRSGEAANAAPQPQPATPAPGPETARAAPKVYKTRAGAMQAKKEAGNTKRLKKVKGGFILREATDKELEAAEKAARRLSAPRAVDVDRDSLLTAIAKLGGLSINARSDTIGEGNKNLAGKMLFTRDGQAIDEMARGALREYGYIPAQEVERDGGVRWLRDAIKSEFNGTSEHFSEQGTEWMEDAQRRYEEGADEDVFADLDADDLSDAGYTAASPEVQALTERLIAEATAQGIDAEALAEDAARITEGKSENEYHQAFQAALSEAVARSRGDGRSADAGAAQAGRPDRGAADGEEGGGQEGLTPPQEEDAIRADFGAFVRDQTGALAALPAGQWVLLDFRKADYENGQYNVAFSWGNGKVSFGDTSRTPGEAFSAAVRAWTRAGYPVDEFTPASKAAFTSGVQDEGLLASQSEQDLRDKADREAAAAKADAAEQKRRADKAKADAERDEFTLTGSDRPADVAAAAGQGGLFDGASPTEVKTAQDRIEELRLALRKAEDAVLAAAPANMGAGGGDIDAAMRSRAVPSQLKARRIAARDALRAAQAELDATPKSAPAEPAQPAPAAAPAEAQQAAQDQDDGLTFADSIKAEIDRRATAQKARDAKAARKEPARPTQTTEGPDPEVYRVTPDGNGAFTLQSDESTIGAAGGGGARTFSTAEAARAWAKANGFNVQEQPTPARYNKPKIELLKRLSVLRSLKECIG